MVDRKTIGIVIKVTQDDKIKFRDTMGIVLQFPTVLLYFKSDACSIYRSIISRNSTGRLTRLGTSRAHILDTPVLVPFVGSSDIMLEFRTDVKIVATKENSMPRVNIWDTI